jgi:hypothetical protein
MQPISPVDFFDNEITSYGSLSFDYDTENRVAYFGSAVSTYSTINYVIR